MPKLSPTAFAKRAARIKVFLLDVDGVLTNGLITHFVNTGGELVEFKPIHAQDSIALHWLAQSGVRTGVISGRVSKGIAERLKLLDVTYVYQHRLDKIRVYEEILRLAKVSPEETLYIGDDLPDIPVMTRAAIGVCPANARPEVKAVAGRVTRARGGDGAVREVVEAVMKAQGTWRDVLDKYAPSR